MYIIFSIKILRLLTNKRDVILSFTNSFRFILKHNLVYFTLLSIFLPILKVLVTKFKGSILPEHKCKLVLWSNSPELKLTRQMLGHIWLPLLHKLEVSKAIGASWQSKSCFAKDAWYSYLCKWYPLSANHC